MKKATIFVLFIFVFYLTGCTKEANRILEILDSEIITCGESCINDLVFDNYREIYYDDALEAYQIEIAPHKNETVEITLGEMYTKDQIPRLDPVSYNGDIPIYYPYTRFDVILDNIGSWIYYDHIQKVNPNQELPRGYTSVIDIDYGFDDHSGYLMLNGMDKNGNEEIRSYKFNLDANELSFEIVIYNVENKSYQYEFLQNNIYKNYIYFPDHDWMFKYINLATKQCISYIDDFLGKIINLYDPEEEMFYAYKNTEFSVFYRVTQYQDMEVITNLQFQTETSVEGASPVYYSDISLFAMSGWNKILMISDYSGGRNLFFNDDVRVFDDLGISVYHNSDNYFNVAYREQLLESELDDYRFPEEFTGDITFANLKEELNAFKKLDDPFEIGGLTEELVIGKLQDLLLYLTEKYA